ncbi:MAG: hypothetical protein DRP15_02400 [Candidatus Aenigmatarchaeota archaeon]|nr:MAG: hypothetical protein DRP15_02400 [Candidatus Aenigmarchaeota archaeon]
MIKIDSFLNPDWYVMRIATTDVVTCKKTLKIGDVIDLLLNSAKRIPVLDSKKRLIGIISITDVLNFFGGGRKHKIFPMGGLNQTVSKIMEKNVITLSGKTKIYKAIEYAKHQEKSVYPVVDGNTLSGIVSEFDFIKHINTETGITVGDVMTKKPLIIKPHYTLCDVAKILCRGAYRRLPVVENGVLVGMCTPKDILFYLKTSKAYGRLKYDKTEVRDIMNKNVTKIMPEDDIYSAISLMKPGIGGVPVVNEDDELLGIITKRDIMEVLAW